MWQKQKSTGQNCWVNYSDIREDPQDKNSMSTWHSEVTEQMGHSNPVPCTLGGGGHGGMYEKTGMAHFYPENANRRRLWPSSWGPGHENRNSYSLLKNPLHQLLNLRVQPPLCHGILGTLITSRAATALSRLLEEASWMASYPQKLVNTTMPQSPEDFWTWQEYTMWKLPQTE